MAIKTRKLAFPRAGRLFRTPDKVTFPVHSFRSHPFAGSGGLESLFCQALIESNFVTAAGGNSWL